MKKNTVLYIIITILLIIIAIGITYIIMDNKNKEEIVEPSDNDKKEETPNKEEDPVKEDGVTLKNSIKNNDTITQEYEIILNGKEQNIKIIFTYDENNGIKGVLNNNILYLEMDTTPIDKNMFSTVKINKEFNEKNFNLIKGKDNKNYLLIATKEINPSGIKMNYEIFNEQLDKINEASIPFHTSTQCIYDLNNIELENEMIEIYNLDPGKECNYIRGKVENNQIESLFYDCDTIEHRIYTINENKVEYITLEIFKDITIAGQVC